MRIKKWLKRVLRNNNCRNPKSDIGLFVTLKSGFLKKNSNLRKYNVIAYGDTVSQLYKNFKSMEGSIHMMRKPGRSEVVN